MFAAQGLNPSKREVGHRFLVVECHGLVRQPQGLLQVFKRGVGVGEDDLEIQRISQSRNGLREVGIQVGGVLEQSTRFGHVLGIKSP